MKNSYLLQQTENTSNSPKANKNQKSELFNHLLIARIKDTSIMFSFVV